MPFFNFNLLTDPPGDPFVDEDFYWNQNMDKLDTKLAMFDSAPNTLTGSIPTGTEAIQTSGGEVRVWNGSTWRQADSIPGSWGAWTTFGLLSPVVERPLFTPKYRINSSIRRVELSGGLRADVSAGAWSRTKVQVTTNTGGIPDANKPVFDCIQQTACGIGTVTGQFAGARVFIEANAGNSVKISVGYQGDDVGGNFVMLDGIKWFY